MLFKMEKSVKKGISFGLISGIITTLGMIIGLYSITESKLTILGGILVIAVADALSDAMGIHLSEETVKGNTTRSIWHSTLSTFFSKFIFALSFVIPIWFLDLRIAIICSIIWGGLLISIASFYISRERKSSPSKAILEHLFIATLVAIATYYIGQGVRILG